jgi:hypothetical protein
MDRPHQPHVIRTWTVERTRHPVRETLLPKGHKLPENVTRQRKPEPSKKP